MIERTTGKALCQRAGLEWNDCVMELQRDFDTAARIFDRIAAFEDPPKNDRPKGQWRELSTMPQGPGGPEFWLKRKPFRSAYAAGRQAPVKVRWTKTGNLVTVDRCNYLKLTYYVGWQP